jgi:VIT1/CCC1 family predicted Fe2+/Mn2+ transporter
LKSGLSTFVSFMLFGLIPLLPYMLGMSLAFETALVTIFIAFFAIGSIKSRWALASW